MASGEPPFHELSLADLSALCQHALAQYKRTKDKTTDCHSCFEIVRRAAGFDKQALESLLSLSTPLIADYCDPALRLYLDDISQTVKERLTRKFLNPTTPFRPTTFPEYRVYLRTTLNNVMYDFKRDDKVKNPFLPLPPDWADATTPPPDGEQLDRQLLIRQYEKLVTELQWQVIWRRYALEEIPMEIAAALQELSPGIDVPRIYKLTASALKRIRKKVKPLD